VPWDITTLTYTGTSLDISALSTAPTGVFFDPSGTKMYLSSNTGTPNDAVHHWNLSTAWDLASVSYVGYLSVTAQETAPQGLSFSNDGLRLFVVGTTGDDINVYTLTTPWDLTTAVFLTNYTFLSMGLTIATPTGFCISPDGKYSYVLNDIASTATAFQLDIAEYEWNATGTLNANGNLNVYQDLTVSGDVTGPLNVTGTVTSPALVASNGLVVNSNTVSASYSIPSGSSAMSAGPMSVSGGVVVTVPSGSRWVVL
jgi:hypothetical protein